MIDDQEVRNDGVPDEDGLGEDSRSQAPEVLQKLFTEFVGTFPQPPERIVKEALFLVKNGQRIYYAHLPRIDLASAFLDADHLTVIQGTDTKNLDVRHLWLSGAKVSEQWSGFWVVSQSSDGKRQALLTIRTPDEINLSYYDGRIASAIYGPYEHPRPGQRYPTLVHPLAVVRHEPQSEGSIEFDRINAGESLSLTDPRGETSVRLGDSGRLVFARATEKRKRGITIPQTFDSTMDAFIQELNLGPIIQDPVGAPLGADRTWRNTHPFVPFKIGKLPS